MRPLLVSFRVGLGQVQIVTGRGTCNHQVDPVRIVDLRVPRGSRLRVGRFPDQLDATAVLQGKNAVKQILCCREDSSRTSIFARGKDREAADTASITPTL